MVFANKSSVLGRWRGILIVVLGTARIGWSQQVEDTTVRAASVVFQQIVAIPLNGIPQTLLADARGIAIVPNVLKGSFVVGARHGNGVLIVRSEDGGWYAPAFISLTGGNVGWQIGVQSTDVVLVFKTQRSIDGILSGKFTLGADAAVAAGPVGRNAAVATDTRLEAEIYSYSRSRGLFAGVAIDGTVIAMNRMANAAYYRSPGPGLPAIAPPAARDLVQQVAAYADRRAGSENASATADHPANSQDVTLALQHAEQETDALRTDLARIAPQMYELLDPAWRSYLALPSQVFSGNGDPPIEELRASLQRFDYVRAQPTYRALAERHEFQSTYGLLKHYVGALAATDAPLSLPPPPGAATDLVP